MCNAAVYLPLLKEPVGSPECYEISVATNHPGHFLLMNLLLPKLRCATLRQPRWVTLGTVIANSEAFGGKVPIPGPIAMTTGGFFRAGKASKDSKLCNMIISRELYRPFDAEIGVVFNTLYPGCVPGIALFRNAPMLFRRSAPGSGTPPPRATNSGCIGPAATARRLMHPRQQMTCGRHDCGS